jgi:16S rRNA (guanine527-N7)-methyltransferase
LKKNDLAEHFLDCAVLQKHLLPGSVIDLGSGPGFPGICLGIIDPNRELTLVDSNRKKTSFLIHIKNELGLNLVSVKNARAEEIKQIDETNIVCRAFKEPADLLKSLENKISKKNKIILMIAEKEALSAPGFDIKYKESEASKILEKKRGFLEIQMS